MHVVLLLLQCCWPVVLLIATLKVLLLHLQLLILVVGIVHLLVLVVVRLVRVWGATAMAA